MERAPDPNERLNAPANDVEDERGEPRDQSEAGVRDDELRQGASGLTHHEQLDDETGFER